MKDKWVMISLFWNIIIGKCFHKWGNWHVVFGGIQDRECLKCKKTQYDII